MTDPPPTRRQIGATSALLRAKLRPPVLGPRFAPRPRLDPLLAEIVNYPLTTVIAPAGAGKTSLLASWVARSSLSTAWLSVDESDRDAAQFWFGAVAALDGLAPGHASDLHDLLRRPGAVMDAVYQLLESLDGEQRAPAVFVVDDFHLVDADEGVIYTLDAFVQHAPSWLHTVVLSRRTPRLPLDRLRAHGQLAEINFAELRFSRSESKELLSRLAPSLPHAIRDAAAERADGWAASLQFAALAGRSAQVRENPKTPRVEDGVLLHDYVLHEVFAAERPELVDTLRELSVASRVNANLGSALTGRADVGELLAEAESRGLFVSRLGSGDWFTLHSLVRRVLEDELMQAAPDRWVALHLRAAQWFEKRGDVVFALDHLLLGGQPRQALRLLALRHAELYDSGREATVVRTIAEIPAAVANSDLAAMLEFAWCHLLVNRRRFRELVDQCVWWSSRSPGDGTSRARITLLRSVAAMVAGSWIESGALARRVLGELGDEWWHDPLGRFGWNMVASDVALGERWDSSEPDVREAELALTRDPERRLAFEGTRALGEALAGHPLEALQVAATVRRVASVPHMTVLRSELSLAEAIAHRELGDREQARAELEALASAPAETMLYCTVLAILELAWLHLDDGDLGAARAAFEQAEAVVDRELPGADGRACLARIGTAIALASGDLEGAQRWSGQVEDPFWRPVLTAQIALAAAGGDAWALLEAAAPRCARHDVVLGLMRARAVDDRDEAVKCATMAVDRAAPYGMMRTVASHGSDVLELVELAAWRAAPSWMDRVRRAALVAPADNVRPGDATATLTERERDVLRFLPSRLTIAEIARELYVSVNTLKFHLKIIYRKLGVNSRAEAAEIARRVASIRTRP